MITSYRIAEQRRLRTFILFFFFGCFVFFSCFWFSFWTAAITWSHLIFFQGMHLRRVRWWAGEGKKTKNKTSTVGTQADWKRPAIKSVFFFCGGAESEHPGGPWAEGGLNSTQPHLRWTLFSVPPLSINRWHSPVRLLFLQRCDSEKHFFSLSVCQHQTSSCSKSDPRRGSWGHLSDRQSAVCCISNYSLNCFFWTNIFRCERTQIIAHISRCIHMVDFIHLHWMGKRGWTVQGHRARP